MSVETLVVARESVGALSAQEKLDVIQFECGRLPQIECPLNHVFTPGLYVREIFLPRGAIVVSKVHRTEHPFVISHGEVSVWMEATGWVRHRAPFTGITKPGTRRLLFVHEDCIWTTFHPTTETDLEKIESILIEPRDVEPSALAAIEKLKLEEPAS